MSDNQSYIMNYRDVVVLVFLYCRMLKESTFALTTGVTWITSEMIIQFEFVSVLSLEKVTECLKSGEAESNSNHLFV